MSDFLTKLKKQITKNVAIDFDGVIHKGDKGFYDGTVYGDPLPGTKEALRMLSKKYNLIIYTCKASSERPLVNGKTGIELVWEWLEKHGMDHYINEITGIKPHALFYIDDKAIRFNNWEQTLNDIEKEYK